ncbi:MAG: hypothetical protein MZV65_13300 [Chromatiales bacterium]|nr:hypothetical protein [Chromatiales bacterium]
MRTLGAMHAREAARASRARRSRSTRRSPTGSACTPSSARARGPRRSARLLPAALPGARAKAVRRRSGNRKRVRRARSQATLGAAARQGEHPGRASTGREKNLYSIYQQDARKKHLARRDASTSTASASSSTGVDSLLPHARRGARRCTSRCPGRFKDYIAIPQGQRLPVAAHHAVRAVRHCRSRCRSAPRDMHRVAEAGVAAHWLYKSGDDVGRTEPATARASWLQRPARDPAARPATPSEFLENVKVDLFPDEVYVFTPKGDIRALPRGATVRRFRLRRAHRHRQPLRRAPRSTTCWCRCAPRCATAITSRSSPPSGAAPNPSWLDFVVTGKARAAHPPVPQEPAARRVGGARRAAAGPGARRILRSTPAHGARRRPQGRAASSDLELRSGDDLLADDRPRQPPGVGGGDAAAAGERRRRRARRRAGPARDRAAPRAWW